jgi:hypothetical protein
MLVSRHATGIFAICQWRYSHWNIFLGLLDLGLHFALVLEVWFLTKFHDISNFAVLDLALNITDCQLLTFSTQKTTKIWEVPVPHVMQWNVSPMTIKSLFGNMMILFLAYLDKYIPYHYHNWMHKNWSRNVALSTKISYPSPYHFSGIVLTLTFLNKRHFNFVWIFLFKTTGFRPWPSLIDG